jgi:hypothetical protein
VAHFDDVAQAAAVELGRKQFKKRPKIGRIELFRRRELP